MDVEKYLTDLFSNPACTILLARVILYIMIHALLDAYVFLYLENLHFDLFQIVF